MPYSEQLCCISIAYKRSSSLGTSRDQSSYMAEIGFRSSIQTRIIWFGPKHVWSPLWAQVRSMSSAKTVINSGGARWLPCFFTYEVTVPVQVTLRSLVPTEEIRVLAIVFDYRIFVLVSYVFAGVHFLHFGELKTRFLYIAPFRYRKYILKNFGH